MLGIVNASVEFSRCPRPVESQHEGVIVKLQAISHMYLLLGSKLTKIALHCALPILDRNVEADDASKRARGCAELLRASRLPECIIQCMRPCLLVSLPG